MRIEHVKIILHAITAAGIWTLVFLWLQTPAQIPVTVTNTVPVSSPGSLDVRGSLSVENFHDIDGIRVNLDSIAGVRVEPMAGSASFGFSPGDGYVYPIRWGQIVVVR